MQAGIPVKVYHSDAKEHDSLFIQHQDVVNKGEVAVFDKAYNNYALFDKWNNEDTYFVTRLKNNAKDTVIEEYDIKPATSDQVFKRCENSFGIPTKRREKASRTKVSFLFITLKKITVRYCRINSIFKRSRYSV